MRALLLVLLLAGRALAGSACCCATTTTTTTTVTTSTVTTSTVTTTTAASTTTTAAPTTTTTAAPTTTTAAATTTTTAATTTTTTVTTTTTLATTTTTSTTTTTVTTTTTTTISSQVLVGENSVNTPSNSATNFVDLPGTQPWSATENARKTVFAEAGKIGRLRVTVTAAPGAAASGKAWTITVNKNGVATSLTCQILETATSCTDTTGAHDITVAAGDQFDVSEAPTATPTSAFIRFSVLFQPTTQDNTVLPANAIIASTTDTFIPPLGHKGSLDTEAVNRAILAEAGTVKDLFVWCDAAPAGGTTRTITVRQNGSNTSLACTLTSSGQTCSDTNGAHNVTITIDDLISFGITHSGTVGAQNCGIGVGFVPGTSGDFLLADMTGGSSLNTTGTSFLPVEFSGQVTSENTVRQLFQAATFKTIAVKMNTAPGTGITYAYTLRKNGADTSPAVNMSLSDAATVGNVGGFSTTVADDDLLATSVVVTGGTGPSSNGGSVGYAATYTGTFP